MTDIAARPRYAFAATAIVAVVIAGLTLTPINAPQIIEKGSDKLYHLIAFAALTFPVGFFHPRSSGAVLVFAILFGGAIELIQPSVGRSGTWGDFLADGIGAILGLILGWVLHKILLSPKTVKRVKPSKLGKP